jgi:hypothetical protein
MDVYQILIQDHRTIAERFKEIAGTSNKEAQRRKQLFCDLWIALEDHEITEENDFFYLYWSKRVAFLQTLAYPRP